MAVKPQITHDKTKPVVTPKPQSGNLWTRAKNHRKAWPRKDLPTFYYHSNFYEMLDFVEHNNAVCLTDEARDFFNAFKALPRPAQCLYARLASRKGAIFNTDKFDYPEIENLPEQITCLKRYGFIAPITAKHYAAYLDALTKPELIALLNVHISADKYHKSWTKPLLIDTALRLIDFNSLNLPEAFIRQGYTKALGFIMFLYFGVVGDSLQNFTLRDLGLIKPPDMKDDYGPRFDDAATALAAYFYDYQLSLFKQGRDEDITRMQAQLDDWPEPLCSTAAASRDKLLGKLGGQAERTGDTSLALCLYRLSDSPLCNERAVRLAYGAGDKANVKKQLEQMIDNPASDGELAFAQDFYARKFDRKRTSLMTDILRSGHMLRLDEAYRHAPEPAAKWHYTAQGEHVYRSENHVWKTLFGLLFWDILFESQHASLHNSFERIPSALKTREFYPAFKDKIERRLTVLDTPEHAMSQLLQALTRHHGTRNGIFRWTGAVIEPLKVLLGHAPKGALTQIMRSMTQDYPNMRDGYPDLMRLTDKGLIFTEIKAAGDSVRRNQLTRIRQLRHAGFTADIARIDWVIDPQQIYVVVDVETTGGRAGTHRVTEIGAVKLQGGEIIGEWQSLLNPERSVPPYITRLTGISNQMVASAPLFHDVANSFQDFMGEAIFAAHNVNFDYGFISHEFARLDRKFRHPKICTCSSMRKLYPGHRSYSLKNLCDAYKIDLLGHHRALCDAKAAAQLLKLINQKRLELT